MGPGFPQPGQAGKPGPTCQIKLVGPLAASVAHEEPWIQRCSPLGEARAYVLKPGVNEGFINCYLPNEKFARMRGFKMSVTLPGLEYKHQLDSNTTTLAKQP
ncbi:MAG: hypothetical protein EXS16_11855 [Gemmataceae bacterium]|nr:hypothetical protein [Gemmataceae bacterium]